MRMFARPELFYDGFFRLAQQVVGCARQLDGILSDPASTTERLAEMAALDAAAALGSRQVIAEIEEVVVTPIDREHVHLLASRLADLASLIVDAGLRVRDLRLEESKAPVRALADVLVRAAELVRRSVSRTAHPSELAASSREVERLVDEGNGIYDAAVSLLFADAPDPVEVLRWKEVYDILQHAIRQCKEVEAMLASIALENQG